MVGCRGVLDEQSKISLSLRRKHQCRGFLQTVTYSFARTADALKLSTEAAVLVSDYPVTEEPWPRCP
jgi:methylaspartate ammonia-lyase